MKAKSVIVPMQRGVKVLHDPFLNKGTAFTEEERDRLGLRGLLPPRVLTQDHQKKRVLENLSVKPNDLERYIYLVSLQDRNENLFYRTVIDHLEDTMPIIYTPTVGQACQSYGHLFRQSRGLYISLQDRGRIRQILHNWPHHNVRVIVVTDGERILGLGDLGVYGMGIPIGKLSLYTACAGIHPNQCLPIVIDVGTNNKTLLEDELYLGLQHERVQGEQYEDLLTEFIHAAEEVFPDVLIQLEDFATHNAFNLLHGFKDRACLFDDDIQGTASVALAGVYSALKITGGQLADQRIVFLGAGEAGVGIADILSAAMVEEGLSIEEARQHCWLVDSRGLVCSSRDNLAHHKLSYAHEHDRVDTLEEVIDILKPTVLIGVSGQGGKFTPEVLEKMALLNQQPIIFALSNPTANSECTAEAAYRHTSGRAIFASGSPFDKVELNRKTYYPGQGNNVYIFPGVGLGVAYCKATRVTDKMFLEAARAVSHMVSKEEMEEGRIFPALKRIREVSTRIAEAVTRVAMEEGLTRISSADVTPDKIRDYMYDPEYTEYM